MVGGGGRVGRIASYVHIIDAPCVCISVRGLLGNQGETVKPSEQIARALSSTRRIARRNFMAPMDAAVCALLGASERASARARAGGDELDLIAVIASAQHDVHE
jgi:hypothetical protein